MYHFVMPEHTLLGKRSLGGLPVYHLSQALESESNVSVHVTCIVTMESESIVSVHVTCIVAMERESIVSVHVK